MLIYYSHLFLNKLLETIRIAGSYFTVGTLRNASAKTLNINCLRRHTAEPTYGFMKSDNLHTLR